METNDFNEQTRAEWNKLGFFYDYDESSRTWLIRANRKGMERFCEELRQYAADSRNAQISEHQHYGPYSYLKFVTWTEAKIITDGLYGRLEDFDRLADLVTDALVKAKPGDRVRIDEAYAFRNEAMLELLLEASDFEAASADPALPGIGN